MDLIQSDADIARAVDHLIRVEPRFAGVVEQHGMPPLRRAPETIEGLLRIVTEQLISLRAAEAIWRRLHAELSPLDLVDLGRRSEASLMQLGLSGAKARTFLAIAKSGLEVAGLRSLPDDEVFKTLTAVRGIGPWTAQIFLLSNMGRPDVWPLGDLALERAAQHLFELPARPQGKAITELTAPWRPYRAVAARLLWSHYRGLKGLSQTVA